MGSIDIQRVFENSKFIADEIEYLNHYTSLDSLRFILKNKSLKLTRIDKVNDLLEYSRMDAFDDKKGFVSCLTKRQRESFFFWKTYSHKQEGSIGVRISFPPEVAFSHEFFFDSECLRPIPIVKETDFDYCQYDKEADWGVRLFSPFNVNYISDLNDLKYEDEVLRDFLDGCVTACRLSPERHYLPGIVKTKEWDSEEEVRIVAFLRPKGRETVNAKTCFGIDDYPQPFFDTIYLRVPQCLLEECIFTISPISEEKYDDVVESITNMLSVPKVNIRRSVMSVRD